MSVSFQFLHWINSLFTNVTFVVDWTTTTEFLGCSSCAIDLLWEKTIYIRREKINISFSKTLFFALQNFTFLFKLICPLEDYYSYDYTPGVQDNFHNLVEIRHVKQESHQGSELVLLIWSLLQKDHVRKWFYLRKVPFIHSPHNAKLESSEFGYSVTLRFVKPVFVVCSTWHYTVIEKSSLKLLKLLFFFKNENRFL